MTNLEIAERMSQRIQILTKAYEVKFGKKPEALFVPGLMVIPLQALAEELCGRLLDEGFIFDSINGLKIRLVSGNRLGVGVLRQVDDTTPPQEALWFTGFTSPPQSGR